MTITIITVCYNAEKYIRDTIESVLSQTYHDVEYIIIDGNSIDKTMDIIKQYEYRIAKVVSENDKGMYDALNKGLELAKGDYVGILNADDFYVANDCLESVVNKLKECKTDALISDLVIVNKDNTNKVLRRYSSKGFKANHFQYGLMPPHPTFFVKRELIHSLGNYKTDYDIAADFEFMLRYILLNRISFTYLPKTLIKMRTGGISNRGLFASKKVITREILRCFNENNLKTNYLKVNLRFIIKLSQLLNKKAKKERKF